MLSYLVIHYVEGVSGGSCLWLDVDAVVLINCTLAKYDAIERPVEAYLNLHMCFATHNFQAGNVCHIQRSLHIPEVDIVLCDGR